MWLLKTCKAADLAKLASILRDGYEPFAVTEEKKCTRLWFKKELKG